MSLFADFVARFPNTSPVGRLLRAPLRWLPQRPLPILSGPGRGLRWMPQSSVRGMWIGSYERAFADMLAASLGPGQSFFDVGANVGYYTVIASRLVGDRGRVVAIEPHPEAVRRLAINVNLNPSANVSIVEAAAAESDGTLTFAIDEDLSQGALDPRGKLTVRTVSLDGLAARHGMPDVIKIDVEGGGAGVLAGARAILAQRKPMIFLGVHINTPEAEPCRAILLGHGYSITPSASDPDLWVCR